MKNIKKIGLFSLLALSTIFISCNEDDGTGYSTLIVNPNVTGTITPLTPDLTIPPTPPLAFGTTIVVKEDEENSFKFSLNISKPQPSEMRIRVIQTAGNATRGLDYEVVDDAFPDNDYITIPAFSTSASGRINILTDELPEGTETLTLQIGDNSTGNANFQPKTVSFEIKNFIANYLDLILSFGKNFVFQGTPLTLCQIQYDMDYLLFDENFEDTGNVTAQSLACPAERMRIPATLANGTYYVLYYVYEDSGLSSAGLNFTIPTTVEYFRPGGITRGTHLPNSAYWGSSTSGNDDSNFVCTVEVLNGVFTIKDNDAGFIAAGRNAGFNMERIKEAFRRSKR